MLSYEMLMDLFGHYHLFWESPLKVQESYFYDFDEAIYWLFCPWLIGRCWVIYKDYKLVGRSATYTGV